MKLQHLILETLLMTFSSMAYAQYPGIMKDLHRIKECVPLKALAFDYSKVKLLDSPFYQAMKVDQRWLKEVDVNRFLHNYRVTAGIKTTALTLGGWETLDCELRGHSLGHILSALALIYASTGDEQYHMKGVEIVNGLAQCQEVLGQNGYLAAFPEYFIDRAIKGGDVVWAPWYTLHKLYAGLLDQYLLCQNKEAFNILMRMCDWASNKLESLSEIDLNRMLLAEFGGMPETFYNIYAVTGNIRHKKLAEKFYHHQVLDSLAKGKDCLGGLHANTQIPKIIGEARHYEITGERNAFNIATFFWNAVVKDHSYVTGGNSDKEIFCQPGKLSENLSENTTETCNTYNMLKLTHHLFTWNASPMYADFYERALYNHILSSQNAVSGGVTYYHTLHPGSAKRFQYPFTDNTCCVGTGYENHAKYGEAIYYKKANKKGVYVNLFIPSILNWDEANFSLCQETSFPDKPFTKLTIKSAPTEGIKLSILLRYPSWAMNGITVKVNGKRQSVKKHPGSYINLNRLWKQGDSIEMEMPMSLRVECTPDNPRKGAILYGPIVLAADFGKKSDIQVPSLYDDMKSINKWLIPIQDKNLSFKTTGKSKGIVMSPLFRIQDSHYTVYFDFK